MRATKLYTEKLIERVMKNLIGFVCNDDLVPGQIALFTANEESRGWYGLVFLKLMPEFADEYRKKSQEFMVIEDENERRRQTLLWLSEMFRLHADFLPK
ncbi:hypothetical protein HQ571_05465 [Candidatus Kuenenbacteria bacterium]|nr:hypothetical protein [Candidatus Kuenenbacteria bacterium]